MVEPFVPPEDTPLDPGDVVSLHWDYVCQRLRTEEVMRLSSMHDRHLALANAELRTARLEPAR